MGDGPQTPVNGVTDSFNQRSSPPVDDQSLNGESESTVTVNQRRVDSVEEITFATGNSPDSGRYEHIEFVDTVENSGLRDSVDSVSENARAETLDGDTREDRTNKMNTYLDVDGDPCLASIAASDTGYNENIAAFFRSQSTDELTAEFESRIGEQFASDGDLSRVDNSTRFVGGVLASRSDSSVSASDLFGDEKPGVFNADFVDADSEEAQAVFEQMDVMFESVDEYVAGQIASHIEELKIAPINGSTSGTMAENGVMTIDSNYLTDHVMLENGRDVDVEDNLIQTPDRLDESVTNYFEGETIRETDLEFLSFDRVTGTDVLDQGTNVSNTIHHEMMHAYHQSIGLQSREGLEETRAISDVHPDEYPLDYKHYHGHVTPAHQEFAESTRQAAERMIETEKGTISDGEARMRADRDYQKTSYAEFLACGFELYNTDIISSVTEQRSLADTFDRRMTGEGWKETTIDSLRETRTDLSHPKVADVHKPKVSGDTETDSWDTDEGTVALFEFKDDVFDGQNHAAGIVTDVTDDSVTFSYLGNEINVPRDDISSVKHRDWNT